MIRFRFTSDTEGLERVDVLDLEGNVIAADMDYSQALSEYGNSLEGG